MVYKREGMTGIYRGGNGWYIQGRKWLVYTAEELAITYRGRDGWYILMSHYVHQITILTQYRL